MSIFWYIVAGFASGIIGGMGMGGGTLLIPILTIFLDVGQRTAQGINLIVFVPMSIVALIIHCKNKLVNFKIGIPIILSGLLTSVLGSIVALSVSNDRLKVYFGFFLLAVGVWQLIETLISLRKKKMPNPQFKYIGFFKIRGFFD